MKRAPDISALLPDERTIQVRRSALTELLASDPRRPQRRGSRTRRLVAGVAALLAFGGGAAFATDIFWADDIALDAGVACYDAPSLEANAAIYVAAADPLAKCSRTWREGAMTGGASTTVPHLAACAAESSGVMVFPGPDTVCERLGLAPLPGDYAAAGRARARAYAALHVLRSRSVPAPNSICPSPPALAAFARDLLSRTHADVKVFIEGEKPCAGGYELGGNDGDRIAVITVSRARGRANRAARARRGAAAEADAILAPILGAAPRYRRARAQCLDPERISAAARRALAGAGRQDFPLRVAGDGRCVDLFPLNYVCCVTVGDRRSFVAELRTVTLAEWQREKREDRRWMILREAADDAEGR